MCALGVCEKGSNVQVQLRGGTLTIRVTDEGILMTGPAETAYEGDVEV
jgi:diaminopimelate epimerase